MSTSPAREGRQPATASETIQALLTKSRRRNLAVPIRRSFLQQRDSAGALLPGPLASLLRNRDGRGLRLYLLVHAVASARPWDVTLPAAVWARCLGLASKDYAGASISKAWARLKALHLIDVNRDGRLASVRILKEDGSGAPYTYPGSNASEAYFKLPYAYWTAHHEWHARLSLPATSVLLIALGLRDEFVLPADRAHAWYGISPDSASRGVRELINHGLLAFTTRFIPAPLSPAGYTQVRQYRLQGDFSKGHANSESEAS
jgi:hypothetical protein